MTRTKMVEKNEYQALRKSFFDNTLDGVAYCQMLFDKQGLPVDFICEETNKNFEKLTGLRGVVGERASLVLPDLFVSNPELIQIYGEVALTRKPKRFEVYIQSLGKWFFISTYSPRKNFFVSVFQNITDRKLIEKNLENAKIAARNVLEDLSLEKSKVEMAKAKEEAILFSIGDGLIATDEKGLITLVNDATEKLLGEVGEDIMGKPFSTMIMMEDEKGVPIPLEKSPISKALSAGITTTTSMATPGITYYCVRKDQTKFPVAMMVTPVILDERVIGAIEVFRDITQERKVDKAKSEFVSLASHQLRSPLTAISWYTEMILKGDVGETTPPQKKYLEKIYQGNKQMVELVNTLLDVSRIELGTFVVKPEPTNVIVLIQNILDELKFQIEQKKMSVQTKFDKNIPIFSADPRLLRIVFQNLLNNALAYTPDGGRIIFEASLDDGKNIIFKISDTGYGIPESQQDQIFTKLFRADNVRDKDTGGTGLGLYITKSIVENSGGQIWFESIENKGTTFCVKFNT